MVVLIVDDQTNVVNGINFGVNWDKLKVTKVLKSYNAYEAKEILKSQKVDIMLCDIEMPVENGLSLLRWAKNEKNDLECIFLTAHADFIYAKEALQLGGFDYIVQPARYEDIENAILRAIKKIENDKKIKEYYSYGKMIYGKKTAFLDGLLKSWFTGEIENQNSILEDFKKLNIYIYENSRVYFILINIIRWHKEIEEWDDQLLKYALNNIIDELFSHYGQKVLLVQLDKKNFAFVTYTEENAHMDEQAVKRQLEQLIQVFQKYFKSTMACYTGNSITPTELTKRVKMIYQMRDNNVALTSKVFSINETIERSKEYHDVPYIKNWSSLLIDGYADVVAKEAYQTLDNLSLTDRLTAESLQRFYQDFMQVIFNVAEKMNISVSQIFKDKEMLEKSLNSYNTIDNMKELIDYVTGYFNENSVSEKEKKNLVDQIIQYIRSNLDKDIRRTDIADVVFLNPNYVSRLFKNEVGIPLKEYILSEKMKLAQALLKTTNLSISMIAIKVGYSNFSHFSQVYKKLMGATPAEDRQTK